MNSNIRKKHLENYNKLKEESSQNGNNNQTEYISKDPKELSLFFKEEGNIYFLRKEYEIALIYFTKAIEYDNTSKVFFSNRSACHLATGHFRLALKDALKSIELDSSYVKGYYRAALAYFEMNELDMALKLLKMYKEEGHDEDVDFLSNKIVQKIDESKHLKEKFPSFDRFLTFNKWLHEEDVYFSKLEIKFFSDDHRGVLAKQDINKDEVILKVPKEMLISIELAKTTEIGGKISSFMFVELNSPKHCLLSSFLLIEKSKGEASNWKSYLSILPKDYSSFPIFYTDEDLTFLEGSPFLNQILEKREDMHKDYEKICDYVPEFRDFNFKDFCESRMAVSSRIFGVKINFRKTDVLAPFADLLNHKRPRTTHWFYDDKYKSFLIQSLENIPKGTEVFDSYGKKCNSRFLLNYGFIIEDNDANEFPITLVLDDTCPLFEEKKVLFKKVHEYTKKFRISENIVDYQVVDFFSFLRFIIFDGDIKILFKIIHDNQKLIFEDNVPSFYLISPISKKSEIKLLNKIEEIMVFYLNKYKTTIEEDEAIIAKEQNLTNNQKNCISMRICEKKILNFFLNFARYSLNLFSMEEQVILFIFNIFRKLLTK